MPGHLLMTAVQNGSAANTVHDVLPGENIWR